jgi:hypothetical protein
MMQSTCWRDSHFCHTCLSALKLYAPHCLIRRSYHSDTGSVCCDFLPGIQQCHTTKSEFLNRLWHSHGGCHISPYRDHNLYSRTIGAFFGSQLRTVGAHAIIAQPTCYLQAISAAVHAPKPPDACAFRYSVNIYSRYAAPSLSKPRILQVFIHSLINIIN